MKKICINNLVPYLNKNIDQIFENKRNKELYQKRNLAEITFATIKHNKNFRQI